MSENKTIKPKVAAAEKAGRHDKNLEERRLRQAEALRANLKKRKSQIRQRDARGQQG